MFAPKSLLLALALFATTIAANPLASVCAKSGPCGSTAECCRDFACQNSMFSHSFDCIVKLMRVQATASPSSRDGIIMSCQRNHSMSV
jgi:hypothetical protein